MLNFIRKMSSQFFWHPHGVDGHSGLGMSDRLIHLIYRL